MCNKKFQQFFSIAQDYFIMLIHRNISISGPPGGRMGPSTSAPGGGPGRGRGVPPGPGARGPPPPPRDNVAPAQRNHLRKTGIDPLRLYCTVRRAANSFLIFAVIVITLFIRDIKLYYDLGKSG